MKNLLFLFLIIFTFSLSSCKVENTTNPPPEPSAKTKPKPTPPPKDEPTPEPDPPPPEAKPFKLVSINGQQLQFFDGQTWTPAAYEKKAAPGEYMAVDAIYQLDGFGIETIVTYAPEPGDLIKKTSTGYTLCDIMPPAESLAGGGLYKNYSQIHKYNGSTWSEPSHWSTQKWTCDSIYETDSGQQVVVDTAGIIHTLGTQTAIHSAEENGLFVYNLNPTGHVATFATAAGTTSETWVFNYFLRATQWQKLNGKYYSHNGFEYSFAGGLVEAANVMDSWNAYPYPVQDVYPEIPVLVALGVDPALNVVYWIECNTGWLIEHRIATNSMSITKRLYMGPGTRAGGNLIAKTIKPIIFEGQILFNYQGSVLYMDLATGGSGVFLAVDASVEVF